MCMCAVGSLLQRWHTFSVDVVLAVESPWGHGGGGVTVLPLGSRCCAVMRRCDPGKYLRQSGGFKFVLPRTKGRRARDGDGRVIITADGAAEQQWIAAMLATLPVATPVTCTSRLARAEAVADSELAGTEEQLEVEADDEVDDSGGLGWFVVSFGSIAELLLGVSEVHRSLALSGMT